MITVALYDKKTKYSPENEPRHFYSSFGTMDVDMTPEQIAPSVQHAVDGVLQTFDFDEAFSKEVGHYAYVRNQDNVKLTPFSRHADNNTSSAVATDDTKGNGDDTDGGAGL